MKKLGELAEVLFGIKTGANEFFYIDQSKQDKWRIESRYLKDVVLSPREINTYSVDETYRTKFKLFVCDEPKSQLKNTNALKYILWGEKSEKDENGNEIRQFNKRPSCRRKLWYSVPKQNKPQIVYPLINNDSPKVIINEGKLFFDANFVCITYKKDLQEERELFIAENLWTFVMLCWELFGIANLGQGAIKQNPQYVKNVVLLEPTYLVNKKNDIRKVLSKIKKREIKSIFVECGIDPNKPIREQTPDPLPDRAELDKIISDVLGLTEAERKELYWSVCELVHSRLEKAESLKGKKK
jgi:hypothetical protein